MMLAAFLTGLLGSLHCLGMCGPLALALPVPQGAQRKGQGVAGKLLYNTGRLVSYALLGGLVSLVGVTASMFDFQRYASIVMGSTLVLLAFRGFFFHAQSHRISGPISKRVSRLMGRFWGSPKPQNLFGIGLLNGVLPCGLVYIGLFQAALAPSALEGVALMALFGLGTWPMMLGISISGPWIRRNMMGKVKHVLPMVMLITGIMLSVRGMALGIPYLSPKIEQQYDGKVDVQCHSIPSQNF